MREWEAEKQGDWGERMSPESGLWGHRKNQGRESKGAGCAWLWVVRGQRR